MLVQVKALYYQNELDESVERRKRWSQFLLSSSSDLGQINARNYNLVNVSVGR